MKNCRWLAEPATQQEKLGSDPLYIQDFREYILSMYNLTRPDMSHFRVGTAVLMDIPDHALHNTPGIITGKSSANGKWLYRVQITPDHQRIETYALTVIECALKLDPKQQERRVQAPFRQWASVYYKDHSGERIGGTVKKQTRGEDSWTIVVQRHDKTQPRDIELPLEEVYPDNERLTPHKGKIYAAKAHQK